MNKLKEKVKDVLERVLWLLMLPFFAILLFVIGTLLYLLDWAVGNS